MEKDKQLLQELIWRYHQAFTDRDCEAALSCLADFHFRVVGNASDDPTQWAASGWWTKEALEGFRPDFKDLDYRCECHILKVGIRNNLGIVVTRETGSSGSNSFKEATNVWLTANIDGEWKIIGCFFRDVKSDQ